MSRGTLDRIRGGTAARLRRARGRLIGTLTHVRTDRHVAALTFDDGPDPDHTPTLLDILADHGAAGTFFVVGDQAAEHRDLLSDIAGRGHAIGNHTWDHRSMPGLTGAERREQLDDRDLGRP